jgi:hypothetical protein
MIHRPLLRRSLLALAREYLPGYYYDPKVQLYLRRGDPPAVVPRAEIQRLLDQHVRAVEDRLRGLLDRVLDGVSSPGAAYAQMQNQLRNLYLQNRALGSGGWDQLAPADYGHIGGTLKEQYERWSAYCQALRDGEISPALARSRLHMYLGNARKEMYLAQQERAHPTKAGRALIEIRTLGAAEHCESCVAYHNQGWQEQGVLPVPGEGSECDGNCRCSWDVREVSESALPRWIGTRREA